MQLQIPTTICAVIIGVAIIGFGGGCSQTVNKQASGSITQAEIDSLCRNLSEGADSSQALQTVLNRSDRYPSLVLFTAAATASAEKRLEDAGFLFYVAKQRMLFDKACFPPKGEGGDSPFTLLQVLQAQIGSVVNPAVMDEPRVFTKAVARAKAWSPQVGVDDVPGYEFLKRRTEKEALAETDAFRTKYVQALEQQATLMNDAKYFAAAAVVKNYNFGRTEPRPTDAEYHAAGKEMQRIAAEKGFTEIAKSLEREFDEGASRERIRKWVSDNWLQEEE